jgi:antitoxin CptB
MISPQRKAKITWRCRRGMLELDLILQRFLKQSLDAMTEQQLASFESLLENPDPDLYAWFMEYEKPPSQELLDIVAFIRLHDNT